LIVFVEVVSFYSVIVVDGTRRDSQAQSRRPTSSTHHFIICCCGDGRWCTQKTLPAPLTVTSWIAPVGDANFESKYSISYSKHLYGYYGRRVVAFVRPTLPW